MKKVIIKSVNIPIFILSLSVATIVIIILSKWIEKMHFKAGPAYTIIPLIVFCYLIAGVFIAKSLKILEFNFNENNLSVLNKKNNMRIDIKLTEVKNYNLYKLFNGKIGHIIRIREKKNYLFWLTNDTDEHYEEYQKKYMIFLKNCNQYLNNKKFTLIDYIIYYTSNSYYFLLFLSLLSLLGIFIWLIFFL